MLLHLLSLTLLVLSVLYIVCKPRSSLFVGVNTSLFSTIVLSILDGSEIFFGMLVVINIPSSIYYTFWSFYSGAYYGTVICQVPFFHVPVVIAKFIDCGWGQCLQKCFLAYLKKMEGSRHYTAHYSETDWQRGNSIMHSKWDSEFSLCLF